MANIDIYKKIIEDHQHAFLKGKANPYTSVNGRMYSFIDKAEKLSIRLNKEDTAEYASKYEVQPSIQHNSVMRDYVLVPQEMLENEKDLKYFFNKSYEHFNSLPPKPTKKKK